MLKNRILKIAKVLVLIMSLGYIVFKLWYEKSYGNSFQQFLNINAKGVLQLLLVFVLMFFNWGIETVKWQKLLNKIELISFKQSYKSVLTGITVSIFTPNRVGDFGGRIFYLHKENRARGVVASLLGNYVQLLVTIMMGFSGLVLFSRKFHGFLPLKINQNLFFIVLVVVILVGISVYLSVPKITRFIERKLGMKSWVQYVLFFRNYKSIDLLLILSYSVLRYLIFTTQYFLLLKVFKVDISFFDAYTAISLIYLIMAIVPTFAIAEVGVRGSVAVFIFELFALTTIGVLTASVVLWFFNLAIPALIGWYYLIKLKI